MTEAELKEIRERAEKATPGPWEWSCSYESHEHGSGLDVACDNIDSGRIALKSGNKFIVTEWAEYADDAGISVDRKDAEFIAHARADIPKLIDCIQGLKADLAQTQVGFKWLESENGRLREALEWYGKLEGEWRSECTISPNTPFSRSWEQSEPFDIGKRARDALEGK